MLKYQPFCVSMSLGFVGNESQTIIRIVRPYWEFQHKTANATIAGQCCGGFAAATFIDRKEI